MFNLFRRKSSNNTDCDNHIPQVLSVEQKKCVHDSEDKVCKVTPHEK